MSGSNTPAGDDKGWRPASSSSPGDGKGGPSAKDKCTFTETTILNSPDAAVIGTLAVGQVLRIELQDQPRRRLVAVASGSRIAGAITSAKLVDMIECITLGFSYSAKILEIQGGRVTVEIHPS